MNTQKFCNAIKIPITLLFLSAPVYSTYANDAQNNVSNSSVQTTVLQSGQGYELKELLYTTPDGQQKTSTLYFIHSAEGAKNAAVEAGLPEFERNGVIKDFQHKSCSKANTKCEDSSTFLVLVDQGIADHLNDSQADFNSYIASRGLTTMQDQFMSMSAQSSDNNQDSMHAMYSCNGDTDGNKFLRKSTEFPMRDSHTSNAGPGSVTSNIDANFKVDADAKIYYTYSSTLCVPHKIKLKKVDASAKYQITGDIDINGQVSGVIPTFDWHSHIVKWDNRFFMIGPIPIEYDLSLPVSAGIGDITYKANGDVGLKKQLEIDGDFKFECTLDSCKRISSSYDDHGLIKPDDIKYSLMAQISVEPYIKVQMNADLFKKVLWAQVGASAQLPMTVIGYYGNTCGNGDGFGKEETVSAGLINVDLNVNAYAHGNKFKDKNWPIINKNLFFTDLVRPSTAMSPIVRPSVQDHKVDLLVAVRNCVSQVPSSYQNYLIDWGDGSTEKLSNMNNSKDMLHNYAEKGDYTVKVKHQSGPSTTVHVKI